MVLEPEARDGTQESSSARWGAIVNNLGVDAIYTSIWYHLPRCTFACFSERLRKSSTVSDPIHTSLPETHSGAPS